MSVKQIISIAVNEIGKSGKGTKEIEASVYGDFAVHGCKDYWSLTHVPTGYQLDRAIPRSFLSKKSNLVKLAKLLGPHDFKDISDQCKVDALKDDILSCIKKLE